ncbi:GNAT family N-acetyltransferase [Halocatena salina]|uniref:GNAT family N-acetyltransferase n=1 Tax=Halocatena salina TaxID=2934340 RepID=A0A8U0A273_9EURY|nr:GNAT family N-acetyltransferase [Halocatena salina]UPM42889.1 GNAT family N-acetyltransferase [Halocatena salina]
MSTNSIETRNLSLSEWTDVLPDSGTEVFHTAPALEAVDDHTEGELQLYGGFKGDQPVALLPVFVDHKAVGRIVTSPPPSMGIPRLGPLLLSNSPKQRKKETVNYGFTAEILDDLSVDARLTLFRVICPRAYADPRPFQWNQLKVTPEFTYILDLENVTDDTVMDPFSRSLRNEMRRGEEIDVTVGVEGRGAAKRIWDSVGTHFEEQGMQPPIKWEFVRDLLEALPEHHRVYVAREPDGSFSSGIIVLYSDDTAYFWLGGIMTTYDGVSVNSLLHRRVIEDIVTEPQLESVTRYDLVGANTERLCEYKGKFSGDLVPYYVVESVGPEMKLAKGAYDFASR